MLRWMYIKVEGYSLEDIIKALYLVGDNGRADDLAAEILGVSLDKLWEIEDNFEE